MDEAPGRRPNMIIAAWAIHALTASGAILAVFALRAVERGDWHATMLWLVAALIVDGIDGPLARRFAIKESLPHIDGVKLDLIVDYLTYVFVPTILILQAGLVAPWFALPAVALIQLSSLYHFVRTDSKSTDNYFVGFPALWNVVAFYLLATRAGPTVGAIVVCALAAMTFAPVYFIHPMRVRDCQPWAMILTVPWTIASVALFWSDPHSILWSVWLVVSLASAAALLAIGLIRTWRGPGVPSLRG